MRSIETEGLVGSTYNLLYTLYHLLCMYSLFRQIPRSFHQIIYLVNLAIAKENKRHQERNPESSSQNSNIKGEGKLWVGRKRESFEM